MSEKRIILILNDNVELCNAIKNILVEHFYNISFIDNNTILNNNEIVIKISELDRKLDFIDISKNFSTLSNYTSELQKPLKSFDYLKFKSFNCFQSKNFDKRTVYKKILK